MHFDAVEERSCIDAQSRVDLQERPEYGEPKLNHQPLAAGRSHQRLRRCSRYLFDARIQLSVFREGVTTKYWGRTGELSQDGLGATLSGELQTGEVVSLEFPLPLPPHSIQVRAVVRYNKGLRHGFEFLVMSHEQRLVLHQLCVVLANAS